jgi:phosphoglycerol transferase MdoB-like AlkP superfamily enzyme
MLIRLISVISLFQFMLLLLSGTDTSTALYRSILVFTVLFAVVYLGIFFLNIIRGSSMQPQTSTADSKGEQSNKKPTKKEGIHE